MPKDNFFAKIAVPILLIALIALVGYQIWWDRAQSNKNITHDDLHSLLSETVAKAIDEQIEKHQLVNESGLENYLNENQAASESAVEAMSDHLLSKIQEAQDVTREEAKDHLRGQINQIMATFETRQKEQAEVIARDVAAIAMKVAARKEPVAYRPSVASAEPQQNLIPTNAPTAIYPREGQSQSAALVSTDASADPSIDRISRQTAPSPEEKMTAATSLHPDTEYLMEQVHFNAGSDDLTPGGERKTRIAAAEIAKLDVKKVRVVGFSDRVGDGAFNQRLSQERAQSVADMLIASGVPEELIEIVGHGEQSLPEPTADHIAEPLNRCVGITFIPAG